jgi:hypothetical protein
MACMRINAPRLYAHIHHHGMMESWIDGKGVHDDDGEFICMTEFPWDFVMMMDLVMMLVMMMMVTKFSITIENDSGLIKLRVRIP